jgi:aryl-alcohol dehydrogenase-like predicted oxidoreductase
MKDTDRMRYRSIPSAGVAISEIGFGCGGTAGLMVRGSAQEQRSVVERALQAGINYFDVAPDYGDGRAEENLGRVLRELSVRPYITTKVEIRAENLADVASHVVRSAEASLKRLGVEYVDVLQIHNAPASAQPTQGERAYAHLALDHYLGPSGALEGLERLKRDGKTRFLGFIVRGGDVDAVDMVLNTRLFHLINASYHLLNPTAGQPPPYGMRVDVDWGQVIQHAEQLGVGVAVYSPLANGLLTDTALAGASPHPLSGSRLPQQPDYPKLVRRAQALGFLSVPGVQSLSQMAYRFVLMSTGVTTVLGGFSATSHLEQALAAAQMGPLPTEDLVRLEMVWRANFGV